MIVGVPRETARGERRVAVVPAAIPALAAAGLEVLAERGAGEEAGYPDALYAEKGARLAADRAGVFGAADVIALVRAAGASPDAGRDDLPLLHPGQGSVGQPDPQPY